MPGYETATYTAVFAPARTPHAIVDRLHKTIADALSGTQTVERYLKAGMEPVASSPEKLRSTMKNELDRMAGLIRDTVVWSQGF